MDKQIKIKSKGKKRRKEDLECKNKDAKIAVVGIDI